MTLLRYLGDWDRNNNGSCTLEEFTVEIEPVHEVIREAECAKDKVGAGNSLASTMKVDNEKEISPRIQEASQNVLLGLSTPLPKHQASKSERISNLLGSQSIWPSVSTAANTTHKEKEPQNGVTFGTVADAEQTLSPSENKIEPRFIYTLKKLLGLSRELENAKEELALRPDFIVPVLFKSFEPEMRVYVNEDRFEKGLKRYCIFPNKKELELLFKRLDGDKDGILRTPDFEEMLLSKRKEFSLMVKQREPFGTEKVLSVDEVNTMKS